MVSRPLRSVAGEFGAFLSEDGLTPLSAFTPQHESLWLDTLSGEQRELASQLLREFREYVTDWGWLAA